VSAGDSLAELGRAGVDQRLQPGDFDHGGRRAYLELDVDGRLLGDLQDEITDNAGFKAGGFGGEPVGARQEPGDDVPAGPIGLGSVVEASGHVGGSHGCAGDDGTGRVGDDAADGGVGGLSQGWGSQPGHGDGES